MASLIFVGVQVRQSQSAANVSQIASYMETILQLRLALVEHADIWQRACAGEELSAAESVQAAQLYRSYTEWTYTQGVAADLGMFDYRLILAGRYAANIHRYPGFAKMGKAQTAWTSDAERATEHIDELRVFRSMVNAELNRLREMEPNPDFDTSLCGL